MAIHWSLKLSLFAASVVGLSWFFAGWRQVNQSGGLGDWGVLIGGTATTLFLVVVQGYTIYIEEKNKGRLRKRIELYEKVEKYFLERAKAQSANSALISDSENSKSTEALTVDKSVESSEGRE